MYVVESQCVGLNGAMLNHGTKTTHALMVLPIPVMGKISRN